MKQSLPPTTDGHEAGTSDDVKLLQSMGYAQELHRRMSGFSNFAISFSIICILAGGITSLQLGLSAVGGAAAGVVWPAGVVFCFMVALCMAQIASAFPTAGGIVSLELDPGWKRLGLGRSLVQPRRPHFCHCCGQRGYLSI